VYTPQDKAIQTPNSDTPYSFLGADVRAGRRERSIRSAKILRDIALCCKCLKTLGNFMAGRQGRNSTLAGNGCLNPSFSELSEFTA